MGTSPRPALQVVGIAAVFCLTLPLCGHGQEQVVAADKLPAEPATVLTCASPVATVTPADNLKYVVTVDPHTIWRPVGGDVTVTVTGQDNLSLNGLVLQTCFARRSWGEGRHFIAGGPITITKSSGQEVTFRTTVPDVAQEDPKYWGKNKPSWFRRNVIERWESLVTDSSVVPIAYLRVIGTGGPAAKTPVDVLLPIGITSVSAALTTTLIVVALALFVLWRFVTGRPQGVGNTAARKRPSFLLAVIASDRGAASLSQFQVVLWTFVVGASAVYVILLSGNLIDISSDVLTLLGITGVALLGAKLPAAQPAATAAAVGQGVAPAPNAAPRDPKWSDLVADADRPREIDVSRVQMLFFTVVSALFVLLKVFGNYAIPELPSGYLLLMGISNGVYLANKFVPKS